MPHDETLPIVERHRRRACTGRFIVAHPSETADRLHMHGDYYSVNVTALSVASTMTWTCGMTALVTIRRHVARCLEDGLIDEAEFWLKVRNQAETLLTMERNYGGTYH
ncbi:unnamed protein product (plasmid) [Gluconacetobacter diazotrophicus PA1 5]|uniref:Uncharacterized protein n=1 Tax=Gluconacetobacter diazotrophicus (strain ATCC 49037 / DSM 5601 / CCUG 37298 / CIP 103539 / LMG 7603 / PAl5) TaxID=272568 RepID=A9HSR0_GLUDA|nr:unnamed protein product [Gluconacetobacter diazotrophicus PA1 5]